MSTILARLFAAIALSASVANAAAHDMSLHHEMPAAEVYQSHGVIKKVAADSLSIAHKPVPALSWPAMTMTFSLPAQGTLPPLKAGDTVDFTFSQQADGYQLTSVTPTK
ncbi:copper-binding protein [Enterobacteriaceae bacterium H20N1]|uniref:Copper-binding protein n=1 Tax=Dryocola boscaweniae TaxID=2925397 RepID=A0A9X2W4A5_9ENTR|nr:copper-binding protein [Dryocola boscaweniae]MCT4700691.1 copper-binding protein [Dryocola boscaweniae]MCT4716163.1 copper-binding protein [Dryocola boscaweniae]MCT4717895.1 copper-binding protein [Dryocola boscaweniae]